MNNLFSISKIRFGIAIEIAFALLAASQSSRAEMNSAGIQSKKLRITTDLAQSQIRVNELKKIAALAIEEAPLVQVAQSPGNFVQLQMQSVKVVSQGPSNSVALRILYSMRQTNSAHERRDEVKAIAPQLASCDVRFINPQVIKVTLDALRLKGTALKFPFLDRKFEAYYGVWESVHGGHLDNRGASADFLGTQIADNVDFSSGRSPFFMSSLGYGVYIPTNARGRFTFGRDGVTAFSFEGPSLQFYIIYGPSFEQMLYQYNRLSGPVYVPPLWAYGTGWWRDDSHLAFHGKVVTAQQNVLDDADHLRDLRIPASWLWLDRPYGTGDQGWGNFDFDSSFPDPHGLIADLKARGLQLLAWIANKAFKPSQIWSVSLEKKFLCQEKPGSAVDVSKVAAYEWFRDGLEKLGAIGIKGYKIDRGEEDQDLIPDSLKNSLNDTFAKLAGESLRKKWGSDYFIFSRNLNTSGRRDSALWGGDAYSSFDGLQTSITEALRAGLIGFPIWGSDTGGIMSDNPSKEVFARWFAFSAYSPMMEVLIGGHHTPWYDYDSEMVEIARKFSTIHHQLIPYTRSMFYQASQTGMPILRPLFLASEEDRSLRDRSDQYFYGNNLLVAPVVAEKAKTRAVYFPKGRWLDYEDKNTVHEGTGTDMVPAPLNSIPVFVREGAIIVRGDILQANNRWTPNWRPHLDIEFFPSLQKQGRFDYYDGKKVIKISSVAKGTDLTLVIGDVGIAAKALIFVRGFDSLVLNGRKLTPEAYNFDAAKHVLTVDLTSGVGRTTLVVRAIRDLFSARVAGCGGCADNREVAKSH